MEMTNEEICRSFRLSKDKNEHIKRLADLNVCDKKTILDILTENGEITGINQPKNKPKKKGGCKFSSETKQEIWKLAEEGMMPKDIAERLGYSAEQISNQLYFMRKSNAAPKADSAANPQQLQASPPGIGEQLRRLNAEDAVMDLSEMFMHLKNLFIIAREIQFLEDTSPFACCDTLMVAGENLCKAYTGRLEGIIGQII